MEIIWLDSIGSTQDEAARLRGGLGDGAAVAARTQTCGRGQRGNRWLAAPGENLTFTWIRKGLRLPAAEAFSLSEAASLGLVNYLSERLQERSDAPSRQTGPSAFRPADGVDPSRQTDATAPFARTDAVESLPPTDASHPTKPVATIRIKWPNDIYVGARKICGVLIENTLGFPTPHSAGPFPMAGQQTLPLATVTDSLIGIGLNLNQKDFAPELLNPVSLSQVTGRHYVPEDELPLLLHHLETAARLLGTPASREALHDRYQSLLFRAGHPEQYVDTASGQTFTGTVTGVSREGRLQVRLADGTLRSFAFKEISYLI